MTLHETILHNTFKTLWPGAHKIVKCYITSDWWSVNVSSVGNSEVTIVPFSQVPECIDVIIKT